MKKLISSNESRVWSACCLWDWPYSLWSVLNKIVLTKDACRMIEKPQGFHQHPKTQLHLQINFFVKNVFHKKLRQLSRLTIKFTYIFVLKKCEIIENKTGKNDNYRRVICDNRVYCRVAIFVLLTSWSRVCSSLWMLK